MVDRFEPTEEMIQDYIDGRLNERDHANVAAHLLAHPDRAAEIEELRQLNEALRGLGTEVLDEPIPERFSRIIEAAKSEQVFNDHPRHSTDLIRNLIVGALLFFVGLGTGWFGHQWMNPEPSLDQVALYSAEGAYMLYSVERDYPVEFPADRSADLSKWFTTMFERDVGPPKLTDVGYEYLGGRLLPWSQGKFGFFLFQDSDAQRVAVVFWPRKTPPAPISEIVESNSVRTRYWGQSGFGFAVMADSGNQALGRVSELVFDFYRNALGKE